MAENKTKSVKCPKCFAIAGEYNGDGKEPAEIICKECGKKITYYPDTIFKTTKTDRVTSSGKRFS